MNEEQVSTADIVEATQEGKMVWPNTETSSQSIESEPVTLLTNAEIDELRSRWETIQIDFVDAPRTSVEQADALVGEVMERIEHIFSEKRALLEEQRGNHEEASTEYHRIALQRYRTLFNHLLEL